MLVLLYLGSLLILTSSTIHDHQDCSYKSINLTSNSSVSFIVCIAELWDTVYFTDNTICGNHWSLKNSLVVCKQLGYKDVWTYTNFGVPHVQRSGVSFRCNGTEDKISECYRKGRDTVNGNCSTLAVGCRRLVSNSDVRLVNSKLDNVGDLEVYDDGIWMPLCNHNNTNSTTERVCEQLGWHSGRMLSPITGNVRCVGWNCDDESCNITKFLAPEWAARVECQQYKVTNTMSLDVSLNDDGIPLITHKGRRARICISDNVLDGGDDCENVSTLPQAICESLGYNTAEVMENQTSTYSTQQLPILIGGPSNCTACSPLLPQQTFLDKFTICLPDDVDACDASVDIALSCTNTVTVEGEDGGFGLGAILGIIIGVLLVLLFLSPFIGSTLKSCYKNCVKPWISHDKASTHPTATTNPGGSKASESRGGHSMALSTSEAEPSTYESSTLTKTHSSTGVKTDALPKYNEAMKSTKHNDSTM